MSNVVNVIVPVYNVHRFLVRCLDSIFSQSYLNLRVICVDDGSTDGSSDILASYKNIPFLEIITKTNGGLSSARNAGLNSLPDYEGYILFVDSDDWIEKDYIKTLVALIENHDVDIVCSSFYFAGSSFTKRFDPNIDTGTYDRSTATSLLIRDETIQSHAWSKLFKAHLFKSFRFDENISYMEDQCFTYKLFYASKSVYITNYAGYYYFQNNNNALTKKKIDNRKVVDGLKSYFSICSYNFENNDKVKMVFCANNALASAFLSLFPYFNKRKSSRQDFLSIKEIKKYVRKEKVIKVFVPNTKYNIFKKRLYLICPPFYPIFFKIAKFIKLKNIL